MEQTVSACHLKGKIHAPASKSDAQRAILAAALADGRSEIVNPGNSDDVLSMIAAIGRLGATTHYEEEKLIINGFTSDPFEKEVYVGESGLALRLLVCVCAALGGAYRFTGKGTLNTRDHSFFEKQLAEKGVEIRSDNGRLPIELKGKLEGGNIRVNGKASSQYISGLLMALPLLETDSELTVEELKSKPYVRLTIRTLRAFRVEVSSPDLKHYGIEGDQSYIPTKYFVEADWSSASYWIVAAAVGHEVGVEGLNMQSVQADVAIMYALHAAGCKWTLEHDILLVDGTERKAFTFDATDCPDLFPVLVVLAADCKGITELKGADRLINKESNRGEVLKQEFGKLGLEIELVNDSLFIRGGRELHAAEVDSRGDHRIAMSLAIAATGIRGDVVIRNAEAVGKSYPDFWKDLAKLTQ